jgi:hypothetical protein
LHIGERSACLQQCLAQFSGVLLKTVSQRIDVCVDVVDRNPHRIEGLIKL